MRLSWSKILPEAYKAIGENEKRIHLLPAWR